MPDFFVAAYGPMVWHDFFMGTIGASAALTGLLFVAISINLEQISNTRSYLGEQP